ncbi:MAG: peptidase S41, partial [Bacteroidales bacterium]|nr:peptidase S41 [Bacteroidales bacterium]
IYIMFFDGKEMMKFMRDKEGEEIAKLIEEGGKEKTEKPLAKEEKNEKKDSVKQAEKPEKLKLDLDGREFRVSRLTRSSSRLGDFYLTQDGTKLYYVTPLERGNDLCMLDVKKGDVRVIKKGVYGSIVPSPDDKTLYMFSGGTISKINVASNAITPISFSGDYEFKPKAERDYLFEHVWKQVDEKFYDPAIHGINWAGYRDNYRQFMPYIDNNFDFQDLLSEMLGELNGSHTGARYRPGSRINMGCLGVLYDFDYEGDGLRIAEILPGGVLNIADSEIKAGDTIVSIDGEKIEAGKSWFKLLQNKVGKKTAVVVKKGGKEEELYVVPSGSESTLMYRRWVRQREQMTDKLSGGKVGYTHVQGMDSPSFREVYSKLLGKYRSAESAVVDTRHNGGGWLHDDLATLLGGKEYIRFTPRGQYIGSEPYSKWNKPSCVLMCEDNYSDACGFPYTYRSLGIGKLIGMPVPGTMTAVWWETMLNGMVFGIPQVGSWGVKDGRYLENMQIEPDIKVENDPASLLRGEDKQLETAVKEMMK